MPEISGDQLRSRELVDIRLELERQGLALQKWDRGVSDKRRDREVFGSPEGDQVVLMLDPNNDFRVSAVIFPKEAERYVAPIRNGDVFVAKTQEA